MGNRGRRTASAGRIKWKHVSSRAAISRIISVVYTIVMIATDRMPMSKL